MKYRFMQAHQQAFRLTRMCAVLHVSRSGFYAWQRRGTSARTQANQRLIDRMYVLHQQTREAYRAHVERMCPCITAVLNKILRESSYVTGVLFSVVPSTS